MIVEDQEPTKKFTPKRRTPYLMQDEIINKKNSINKKKKNAEPKKKGIKKEKIIAPRKIIKNQKNIQTSSQTELTSIDYHEEVSKLYGIQKRLAHYFVKCCIARNELQTRPYFLVIMNLPINLSSHLLLLRWDH